MIMHVVKMCVWLEVFSLVFLGANWEVIFVHRVHLFILCSVSVLLVYVLQLNIYNNQTHISVILN